MLNGVAVLLCSLVSDNGDGNGQRMTNINRDGVNHRRPLSDTQQVQAFVQHFSSCIYSSLSVIPVIIRIILIELKLQLWKKEGKRKKKKVYIDRGKSGNCSLAAALLHSSVFTLRRSLVMVCHLLTMKQSKWPLLTVSDCAHFASIHSITLNVWSCQKEVNFQSANRNIRKYQLRFVESVCEYVLCFINHRYSGQDVDNPSMASPRLPPPMRHTLPIDHISTLYRSAFNQRRQWHKWDRPN